MPTWQRRLRVSSRGSCGHVPRSSCIFLHVSPSTEHTTMYRAGLFSVLSTILTSLSPFAGYEWNRSSPLRSSPDTSSSIYPDRPIRPLPRRSLRARLSPEQAQGIEFPDHPPSTGPLFNFPYSASERGSRSLRTGENDHHACHCGHTHSEVESEEEEDERTGQPPSSPSHSYPRNGVAVGMVGGRPKPSSTTSSVDGYESFENTNNKKKRKIPNMGSVNSQNLAADLSDAGAPLAADNTALDDGTGWRYHGNSPSTPQHHNSAPGTGMSGAGRGRFGRSVPARSERRVLANSTNLANAKASSKRMEPPRNYARIIVQSPCANSNFCSGPPEQTGIISTAIANAQASPPAVGNENVSLLQQEAAKHSANKTQFTFTCGSDSANKMVWPGQEHGQYPQPPGAYPPSNPQPHPQARARPPVRSDVPMVSTQGTQTSPRMNGTHAPSANRNMPPQRGGPSQSQQPQQQPAPPPPKPKRSASKLYKHAARKRQIQQEYANFHNPPSNPWICEFCEFEDIFGYKPMALIRQYERKDRQERKRLAEKRRLLEKARMKGRKGKKASKKAQNAQNAQNNQNAPAGGYDRHDDGSLDPHDDEYYDDDYDDLPPAPGTVTHCHHGCQHHPHPPPQKVAGIPPGDPRLSPVATSA